MNIAFSGSNGSLAKELIPSLEKLGCNIYRISKSLESDGKKIFSYEDLYTNSINISVDIFIHAASINSNLGKSNFNDEVAISRDILRFMRLINCKNLIFFSTCKVYGEPEIKSKIIFKESTSPNPSSFYAKAKLECEKIIQLESENSGINSIILRLPPVLNINSSSGLAKLLSISKKIPIFSLAFGEINKRSFLSINNLVTTIQKILENNDLFKTNKLYNLSDSKSISLNKLLGVYTQKKPYVIPLSISKILLYVPFLNSLFVRLYGNFEISNKLIQHELGINLHTTEHSLPIIQK